MIGSPVLKASTKSHCCSSDVLVKGDQPHNQGSGHKPCVRGCEIHDFARRKPKRVTNGRGRFWARESESDQLTMEGQHIRMALNGNSTLAKQDLPLGKQLGVLEGVTMENLACSDGIAYHVLDGTAFPLLSLTAG